jgi:spermidine synthase
MSAAPRFLPVLLLLFFGSGCAALIYEIVWFQLLQLVIGSSAVSLAVLLGTFMGGMCLGSLALPRLVSAARHPLRVCALLELGIAVSGLLVFLAMPSVGRMYTALAGHGLSGLLLRAVVCGLCLLPPTMMMGATLPAVARWIETTPRGVAWLGFFYGGNTLGAVAGCLFTGFYLLRVHDSAIATLVAATLNVGVASVAFVVAWFIPAGAARPGHPASAAESPLLRQDSIPGSRVILFVIALSGLCALAAEVVWTRILSLLLGATVYTFSIILAVFLLGLGLGGGLGAAFTRNLRAPRHALALCQFLQVGALA